MSRFHFPPWVNRVIPLLGGGVIVLVGYAVVVGSYGTSPKTLNIGYAPKQPVPFSHKLHAGQLKMDCRYCHNTADKAAHAAIPPTATCVNCHSAANSDGSVATSAIHTRSDKLLPIRQSQASGEPILWERVHDLPDYAYFDHSAHVNRGVGCVSCHGRVDKMDVVRQVEPLSMSWCLDCHRNPEPHLRPLNTITDMNFVADDQQKLGEMLKKQLAIEPSTNCSTCHR